MNRIGDKESYTLTEKDYRGNFITYKTTSVVKSITKTASKFNLIEMENGHKFLCKK